jgi:hypothetical protein
VFDWIGEWILALVSSVPPLFGSDPHHFTAIRAFAALLVIMAVVYVIAMRPFSSTIASGIRWIKGRFTQS